MEEDAWRKGGPQLGVLPRVFPDPNRSGHYLGYGEAAPEEIKLDWQIRLVKMLISMKIELKSQMHPGGLGGPRHLQRLSRYLQRHSRDSPQMPNFIRC